MTSNTTKGGQDAQAFRAGDRGERSGGHGRGGGPVAAEDHRGRDGKLDVIGRLARVVVHALASPTPPPIYRPAAMTYWPEEDQ